MSKTAAPSDLLLRNKQWAESYKEKDPDFFKRLAAQQSPNYLWVGCSDARVPANDIVGMDPGELFVHRNVANQVIHTDFNGLSVLQFALDVLEVEHIIVCGHYGCGGIRAAMTNNEYGIVDNWLRQVKDIYCDNSEELEGIEDELQRADRLCELNVIKQVHNLAKTKVVQRAWRNGRKVTVHGWIYSLDTGLITDLSVDVNAQQALEDIYWMKPQEK